VLLDAKSDIADGAASVCDVPDVKPDIVSESNDGTVNECVEVTEHDSGAGDVDAIEQVCAALTCAETATIPATAANLRNMVRLRGFGLAASLYQVGTHEASVDVPPPSDSATQIRPSPCLQYFAPYRIDFEVVAKVPDLWCRYSS
jgi:hypothetical protein